MTNTEAGIPSVATLRNGAVDVLRLGLAAMVVGIHGEALADLSSVISRFLTEGLFRIAVPTFFVLSGYFLHRSGRARYRPWALRILWIYSVWMAVYVEDWLRFTEPTVAGVLTRWLFGHHHLWFLAALLFGSLLLHATRSWRTTALLPVAVGLLLAGPTIHLAGNNHLMTNLTLDWLANRIEVHRNFLFVGFPFLALGFLIGRHEPALAARRAWFAPLLAGALTLLAAETALAIWITPQTQATDIHLSLLALAPLLVAGLHLSLIALAPLIVLATLSLRCPAPAGWMAPVAMGVYLVHVHVLRAVVRYGGLSETPAIIATLIIAGLAALALARINRHVPVI